MSEIFFPSTNEPRGEIEVAEIVDAEVKEPLPHEMTVPQLITAHAEAIQRLAVTKANVFHLETTLIEARRAETGATAHLAQVNAQLMQKSQAEAREALAKVHG